MYRIAFTLKSQIEKDRFDCKSNVCGYWPTGYSIDSLSGIKTGANNLRKNIKTAAKIKYLSKYKTNTCN